jgi:hypothetical protein
MPEDPPKPKASRRPKAAAAESAAPLGFEAELWKAADALRSNMDAAEYKHVVLGLIFLKYISDAFEEKHAELEKERGSGADPEDPDEYRAINIFWVPPEARWSNLQNRAKDPMIGKIVDDAMGAIERDNPTLKGVLPKEYARPGLDKARLGQLIDLVGNKIKFHHSDARTRDELGRVFEYFLSEFASAEGKKGGQFYTPMCVVQLLVAMLAPFNGRVFDPCLRVRRHVCSVGEVHRGAPHPERQRRQSEGRPQRVRSGVEQHHISALSHELGGSRHRGQDRLEHGRLVPSRPAPRPEGRLRSREPAVQR